MPFDRYNDGTSTLPRLRVQHSLWSLRSLPMNGPVEWTLDEKFSRVKQAGFEAVECWLTDEDEREHREALDRHGLRLVLGHRPFKLEDVRATVERAVRLGADFIFAQPADAFTPLTEVAALVRDGRKIANDRGIPFFVETHRNNFTETLPQTLQLIEAVPDIRFTADLSHFVVVGEFYGWEEERAADRMMPLLERVSHAHGRISNGEQVQVDVGDGDAALAGWRGSRRRLPVCVRAGAAALRHHSAGRPRVQRPLGAEPGHEASRRTGVADRLGVIRVQ